MEVYTLGFTKRSAAEFFGALKAKSVKRLVDVRLNNVSQLAGFSKRDDLAYFLSEICKAEYVHEPLLAPNEDLLKAYRGKKIGWDDYAAEFLKLMEVRGVETVLNPTLFKGPTVLLCSERTASHCHRRLVIEYLSHHWPDLSVVHL